eukprot:1157922-Pelagomonas_calceolata.AAC.22
MSVRYTEGIATIPAHKTGEKSVSKLLPTPSHDLRPETHIMITFLCPAQMKQDMMPYQEFRSTSFLSTMIYANRGPWAAKAHVLPPLTMLWKRFCKALPCHALLCVHLLKVPPTTIHGSPLLGATAIALEGTRGGQA